MTNEEFIQKKSEIIRDCEQHGIDAIFAMNLFRRIRNLMLDFIRESCLQDRRNNNE